MLSQFHAKVSLRSQVALGMTAIIIITLVMAFSDINECTVSNGGCSHQCVNSVGGYKCECQDPELNLGLGSKSCHGKYKNHSNTTKPITSVCTISTSYGRSVNAHSSDSTCPRPPIIFKYYSSYFSLV